MKIGLIGLVGCMALAITKPAGAQTDTLAPAAGVAWSLDDCIGFAQRNNTNIQQNALKVEQSDVELSTAKYSRLPDLDASVGYSVSFNRSTGVNNLTADGTSQSGSLGLSTSMPLFQGLKINRQIKGGKLDLAAAVQDLERVREDLSVKIMTLYLQTLYYKELLGIAERQLTLSTQQADRSRELVSAGKNPESAIYESEALKANDALNLTQARNDLQLGLLELSQALNRESAAGFDIVIPDMENLLTAAMRSSASTDVIYDYAAQYWPHIRAERLRLENSENSVRIARSALYPSLSLQAGYDTGVYSGDSRGFGSQLRQNSREYIGVSLGVPIFNRRATRNNVRSAQISVRSQQLTLLDAELALRKQIEQAWYNATAASEKFRSATAALASAKVAFEYEQQKADTGRSTIFDFNDAKTRMEKAEADLAQSKFELVFRRKILDYYRGEPLRL